MVETHIAGSRVATAPYNDPSAKFWSLYLDKSERRDKARMQNWKGDMDSILIFAGLFSASVTAFIIESYKNLSPDPMSANLAILTRISQQLQPGINSTALHPLPQIGNFSPPQTSVACNSLWFLSLALSLACALSATLVEQWARHYIHATDSKPHPGDRARISAFLFQGLKRHQMFAVVEAIPILLHLSLFSFFTGLIFFLYPVNVIISFLVLGMLVICCLLYLFVTLSPIIHLDSPYRTPVSVLWWRALQTFRLLKHKSANDGKEPYSGTIAEAQESQAVSISSRRDERDFKAMCWTLHSLPTQELEHFVDVIPNVVVGLDYSLKLLLQRLLHHEDIGIRLRHRIPLLLTSCKSAQPDDTFAAKRANTSLAAIWSLTMMSIPTAGDITYSPVARSELAFDENTLSMILTTQTNLPMTSGAAISTFLVVARGLLDIHSGRTLWFQDRLQPLLDSKRYSCTVSSIVDEQRSTMITLEILLHQLCRHQRLLARTVLDRKTLTSTAVYGQMEDVAQHHARLYSSIMATPLDACDFALVQEVLSLLEQFQCILNEAGFSHALLYAEQVLEPTGKTLYEPINTIRRSFLRMDFSLPVSTESQQTLVTYLDKVFERKEVDLPRGTVDIMLSFTRALTDPICVMKARACIRKYLKSHSNDMAVQALVRLDAALETKQPAVLEIFSSHMYTDAKADTASDVTAAQAE